MARQWRTWENAQVVLLLPPAADAGGRTSMYVSLKYGHKCSIICGVNQGAANLVTFTPLQATDAAGTNSAALTNPAPFAYVLDTSNPLSAGTGTDLFTVTTNGLRTGPTLYGTSYQLDAGLKPKMVIFEIDPIESMNLNSTTLTSPGGTLVEMNHIAIQTSASNAANITFALGFIYPLRDARQNPPTTYI